MANDKKLMVVDDEVEICSFVKMFFEQRGFTVFQAHNGEEAVKVAQVHKPHVVLLDVKMRYEDEGFETLPKIREVSPKSRVLMVTGVEDEASILRGKALGADDYITKPLILEYLETTVLKKVKEAVS